MVIGIYLVIAFLVFVAIACEKFTHDAAFHTRWEAIRIGALVGVFWLPIVVMIALGIFYSYIHDRGTM
ncbi:hypothetical protein LCGC14_2364680 [marine sediment metagenome]|uniref:Uncharacterized protein n=1 Tax=marine sediment metagenome TaxID=412755 RepID=A0A0F9F0B2_9ZZZZ